MPKICLPLEHYIKYKFFLNNFSTNYKSVRYYLIFSVIYYKCHCEFPSVYFTQLSTINYPPQITSLMLALDSRDGFFD